MGLSLRTQNQRRREFQAAQSRADAERYAPARRSADLDAKVRGWIEADAKGRREALDKPDSRC